MTWLETVLLGACGVLWVLGGLLVMLDIAADTPRPLPGLVVFFIYVLWPFVMLAALFYGRRRRRRA